MNYEAKIKYIKENFMQQTDAQIGDYLGITKEQVRSLRRKNSLQKCKAEDSLFKPGHTPWNKGKKVAVGGNSKYYRFPKGHKPHNYVPVGTIVIANIGYKKIKIADPNKWELLHRKIYADKKGPIPSGHIVAFKDGNKLNCSLENLYLMPMKKNLQRNRSSFNEYPESIKTTVKILNKLNKTIRKHAKKQD
jgi:hypothetical protein